MYRYLSVTLFAICFLSSVLHAEVRHILFIGNSYTAVNDLPNTLKSLALAMGDTLEVDSNAPGSMTFQAHTTNATTLAKIATAGWDYVVLQAQSQEPSFDPAQVAAETYPYAKILDSLIHVSNPCAETIFYMTWGRKNGDTSNCAAYPPVCTYEGMQQRLRESYLEMSQLNHATCAPAGVAWRTCRNTFPTIELYQADQSHPSLAGTYLVACTFYSTLYHRSTEGCSYNSSGLSTTDAGNLQHIASATILDSLENWQQYGSLPHPLFSFSNTVNQFTFTNQSLRSTQYDWLFGDGSAMSHTVNPTHTYSNIGNYLVSLKAYDSCGKWEMYQDSIHVLSVVSGVTSFNTDARYLQYDGQGHLQFSTPEQDGSLHVWNSLGQEVWQHRLAAGSKQQDWPERLQGTFYYQWWQNKHLLLQGQLFVPVR